MKFFTQVSNCLFRNWVYRDDVQDIPEPFHRLLYRYSTLHNRRPRNDAPSTFFPSLEILSEVGGMSGPLTSLLAHLYSRMEGIQHAYQYDLCLQPLLKSVHFLSHIFVLTGLYICVLGRPLIHDICTWLPIQYGNLNYLLNGCFFDTLPFNKTKTFIETKVTAMKLQGFNR